MNSQQYGCRERKKNHSFPDTKSYKLSNPEQSSLNICAYRSTNETQSVELMSLCDVMWYVCVYVVIIIKEQEDMILKSHNSSKGEWKWYTEFKHEILKINNIKKIEKRSGHASATSRSNWLIAIVTRVYLDSRFTVRWVSTKGEKSRSFEDIQRESFGWNM